MAIEHPHLGMDSSPIHRRAWPIFSLGALVVLGGINVFLPLYIVPKFEQIFRDALNPNQPLPDITNFIIGARIFLACIGLIWPIAAIIAIQRQHRAADWIIWLGYLFFTVLIAVTIFALFIPMVGGLITGMPETTMTSAEASH